MIKTQHCPNCEATEQKLHDYKQKVSDAVLDGDALPILYLLGVKHGQEDERAKIAAEASQPTQSDALREALGSVIALLDTQAEPPKSVVSVQDYARWANARIGLGLVMIAPRLRAALQEQSK